MRHLDRTKNTIRNFIYGFLNKIVSLLLPFLIRSIIIRTLGREYLGLNNLFTSILSVLNLAELGMGTAMVWAMYEPIAKENKTVICQLLALYKKIYRIIGSIITICGLLLMPFLKHLVNGNVENINIYILYLIFLSDTVLSYLLFAYKSSILTAYQRSDIISNIGTVVQLLLNIVQIVILLIFKNYYFYILMKPLFTIINNIIVNYVTGKQYPDLIPYGNVDVSVKNNIFTRVKALIGHKIGSTVIASADSLVISAYLGLEMLAIYSNYYYIVYFLISVTSIFFNGMLAGIGNSLVLETREKNIILFKNINFMTVWLVTWCSVCLLCLLQPFMTLWMGKDMLLSTLTVILIVIYYYTWQARTTGLFFKDAAGMWNADFWKPYVAAIVNVVINILLVKRIGINGVFISTIICMVLIYFPWETWVLFKKMFGISSREYVLGQVISAIEAVFICVFTYSICSIIPLSGIEGLIARGVICVFVPNIILVIFNYKKQEYIFLKNKIIMTIANWRNNNVLNK